MLTEKLKNYRIILASKSPRRHFLLKEAGIDFEVLTIETEETFPQHLKSYKIPLYLSQKKSEAIDFDFDDRTILITADTIVWLKNKVINKPENYENAVKMLQTLSGNCHEVFTGVTLKSKQKQISFYAQSKVYFHKLKESEIEYYVEKFKPYDKAGAYGIQEWIGYIGIKKIEGSFYNVMGLPVTMLYHKLEKFIK